MARGVREVKALLERAGHTVRPQPTQKAHRWFSHIQIEFVTCAGIFLSFQLVPYQPLRLEQVVPELMVQGVFADGGTSMMQKL